MAARPYIGTGTKHPHQIDQFGKIELVEDKDLVKQSLLILFNTPLGSEFAREHFGSQIRLAMFEPNNQITITLLDYYVVQAIIKWERRIRLVDILYDIPPGKPETITVTIVFKIKQSSEIDSFIFPFYRALKN